MIPLATCFKVLTNKNGKIVKIVTVLCFYHFSDLDDINATETTLLPIKCVKFYIPRKGWSQAIYLSESFLHFAMFTILPLFLKHVLYVAVRLANAHSYSVFCIPFYLVFAAVMDSDFKHLSSDVIDEDTKHLNCHANDGDIEHPNSDANDEDSKITEIMLNIKESNLVTNCNRTDLDAKVEGKKLTLSEDFNGETTESNVALDSDKTDVTLNNDAEVKIKVEEDTAPVSPDNNCFPDKENDIQNVNIKEEINEELNEKGNNIVVLQTVPPGNGKDVLEQTDVCKFEEGIIPIRPDDNEQSVDEANNCQPKEEIGNDRKDIVDVVASVPVKSAEPVLEVTFEFLKVYSGLTE